MCIRDRYMGNKRIRDKRGLRFSEMSLETRIDVSELFTSYETDFKRTIDDLKAIFTSGEDEEVSDFHRDELSRAKQLITEAENCVSSRKPVCTCSQSSKLQQLKHMEGELQTLPGGSSSSMKSKMISYKKAHDGAVRKLMKFEEEIAMKFRKSLNKAQATNKAKATEQRDRLQTAGNSIVRTKDIMNDAQMIAAETEQTTFAIQRELRKNTESIGRSLKTSREIDSGLNLSNALVTAMARRETTNKLILFAIAFVLFCANVIVIVNKFMTWITYFWGDRDY
eukprot:TRINITY_DN11547_c0_g1_i9.p1 TRINITY_DN11547_c0_g1~~TRINITY_DN11547_c0_g1_i9.p1  ORF type:complete len:281 (-),score=50.01 TRINITY_DN11547_c0_g1_i9:247-1089(-)